MDPRRQQYNNSAVFISLASERKSIFPGFLQLAILSDWHPPPVLHTAVNCFSLFLRQCHPHSNSRFLPTSKQGSDNSSCYWCSLLSSCLAHSLMSLKLLILFIFCPLCYKMSRHTRYKCTTRTNLPSQPLQLPENYTIIPCFPCPLVVFSSWFIYDTLPQAVWPPIAMTTADKHLSSQTKSRFSQPHAQLWALLLLDVNGCDCVVQYMYVHVCAHVGQKEWNLAL